MGTREPVAFTAAVKQPDGSIIWQEFKTAEEALAADYRTEQTNEDVKRIIKREAEAIDLRNQRDAYRKQCEELAAKLAEQTAFCQRLQQSLADMNENVLTLCRVLRRTP